MRVIFVHGINHQRQSSDYVRDEWLHALRQALDPADFDLVARQSISVPYYGDVLWQCTEGLTAAKEELQPQSAGAASGDEADFYRSVLTELADEKAIPVVESSEDAVAQGPFYHNRRTIALARAVQALSPLHGRVLLRLLPQAFTYLSRMQATAAVDAIVRPHFQNGPCIVVAHSLGTIVTYKLMRELGQAAPLYLTIGSPLAVRAVQSKIGPPFGRRPAVQRWLNFFDQDDFVTVGKPLDRASFGAGVENSDVDNGDDDPHDFRRYLSHDDVARTLVAALKDAGGSGAA
jgi:hypothetical protein